VWINETVLGIFKGAVDSLLVFCLWAHILARQDP
jgi:hypothetical protein